VSGGTTGSRSRPSTSSNSPEEAQDAGATSARLVAAFIDGYGNSDTSAWQQEVGVEVE
jgi:hypothetical protein